MGGRETLVHQPLPAQRIFGGVGRLSGRIGEREGGEHGLSVFIIFGRCGTGPGDPPFLFVEGAGALCPLAAANGSDRRFFPDPLDLADGLIPLSRLKRYGQPSCPSIYLCHDALSSALCPLLVRPFLACQRISRAGLSIDR